MRMPRNWRHSAGSGRYGRVRAVRELVVAQRLAQSLRSAASQPVTAITFNERLSLVEGKERSATRGRQSRSRSRAPETPPEATLCLRTRGHTGLK